MQLFQQILQISQAEVAVSHVKKCEASLVGGGDTGFNLTKNDRKDDVHEIHKLNLNQEETNTRVVLYLKYAAKKGFKSTVVRNPDANIFFILLHHAASIGIEIFLDTCSRKQH